MSVYYSLCIYNPSRKMFVKSILGGKESPSTIFIRSLRTTSKWLTQSTEKSGTNQWSLSDMCMWQLLVIVLIRTHVLNLWDDHDDDNDNYYII